MMPVISLTTDFGIRNEFVGIMKGVICNIAPHATLVDISHTIAAQDIHEASFTLGRAYSFFPENTIHLYVVDPGVGTMRRAIAARLGEHYFVGPDNGLLTLIIEDAERTIRNIEFVHLENPQYWLPKVSNTFHGRDIFAPVAAHLANGVSLGEFGSVITDPVRITRTQPIETPAGWLAHITVIDVFGNLTTDLSVDALSDPANVLFRLQEIQIHGMVESYGNGQVGDLVVVTDSEGYIEIAEVNGNAARRMGVKVGDVVEVILSE
jgi:S-adenosyl-L-methionine hydrolase (adenosine-forming)